MDNFISQYLNTQKIRQAFLMALGVIFPWVISFYFDQAQYGSIASFGAYLVLVSFPRLPSHGKINLLVIAAMIFTFFAFLAMNVQLGSLLFFIFAVFAAASQALSELFGGYFRLPIALSALAYFLSVGQVPASGAMYYVFFFGLGCYWGALVTFLCIPSSTDPNPYHKLHLITDQQQLRFTLTMICNVVIGSIIACFSPSSHPCWLPAAALRVMKPTRQQTWYRIKARGLGSLLGAAMGGVLLGVSSIGWLHVLLVGILVFIMLLIGAKRYAGWSFCLTAIALAFNFSPEGDIFLMAYYRVLLTAGGIMIAIVLLVMLPTEND